MRVRSVFLIPLLVLSPVVALAQTRVGPADDVEAAINALGPGDELILEDGMYTLSGRFSFDIAGTEAAPILIRAADGARPHLHRPDASQNIVDIDNAEHVVLRGIEFSGGSAGIRISGARFLTIEDCEIHDTEDVALRANDGGVTYESLRILRNHIHDTNGTGEGMYLGCNSDGCRLANGLIEGNHVHHTNQAGVSQGDGIELKEGSFGNVIRDNVIHDTNYPCILTYSAVGNGAANVIERNVMWNCGDHAIQSAADATIRNNIILGSGSDGIAMQPHQAGTPSNLRVVHNTILHPTNDAISLRGTTGSVLIANNALYAQSGLAILVRGGDSSGVTISGNVGVGALEGVPGGFTTGSLAADFVDAHYGGAPPIDVFPAAGGGLVGAGDVAHVVADDFNGTLRGGAADVGAYLFAAGGNPGWVIAADFKDAAPPPPPADGGVPRGTDGGPPPGSDGGVTPPGRDAGPGADGGPGGAGGDDGGCGCRAVGAPDGRGGMALLALGLLALIRRRR